MTAAWQAAAACTLPVADPAWWETDSPNTQFGHLARRWCAACPVSQQCLAMAMTAEGRSGPESRWGIFGGLDPAERARVARHRAKARP